MSNVKISKYTTSNNISSTGQADNKLILELEDDAAHMIMGGEWRMPTKEDWKELYDACTYSWVSNYNNTGIAGRKFILKSDSSKELFFPAAGFIGDDLIALNSDCWYWSSSLYPSNDTYAYHFYSVSGSGIYLDMDDRPYGLTIRGVLNKSSK